MRAFILVLAVGLGAALVACNSQDANPKIGDTAQKPQPGQNPQTAQRTQTPQTVQPAPNSLDTARRITAEELHRLWQKDEVLIVDTRNEPSFKQGHIRGSILIPANEFASRADELPKNKMIVMYCT